MDLLQYTCATQQVLHSIPTVDIPPKKQTVVLRSGIDATTITVLFRHAEKRFVQRKRPAKIQNRTN